MLKFYHQIQGSGFLGSDLRLWFNGGFLGCKTFFNILLFYAISFSFCWFNKQTSLSLVRVTLLFYIF